MANFEPCSTVYLLNTPLTYNDGHQLYFDDRQSQYNYFMTQRKYSYTDFTYQRADNIIRIPVNAEILINNNINYVMYDNINFTSKWVYAYVLKIEFINQNLSYLHIKTDVFQTFFLNLPINPTQRFNHIRYRKIARYRLILGGEKSYDLKTNNLS